MITQQLMNLNKTCIHGQANKANHKISQYKFISVLAKVITYNAQRKLSLKI